MPINTVLYDMSYQNIQLYSAMMPSYNSKKGTGDEEIYIEDDLSRADALLGINR